MNKIKKIIATAFISCLFFSPMTSYAKVQVDYGYFNVNGVYMSLPIAELEIDGQMINTSTVGVEPVVINSRTLVPVRALSEKLGYHVTWIQSIQKVTIEKPGKKIELFIGKTNAKVDNKDVTVTDNVAPAAIDGRTYVPIRFVVENMGLSIDYNANLNKIFLNSGEISGILFDQATQVDELDLFAKDEKTPEANIKEPERPTVTEISKPITPTVPAVTSQTAKDKVSENNNTVSNTRAKYILEYDFVKNDTETFTISQDAGELDLNYFFLSAPKRLVIDIKDAKPLEYDTSKALKGDKFLSLTSLYHSDGNYTRYAITLDENVNNSDLKVEKNKNKLKIEYKEEIKQGEEFKYNFDKKTGSIDIKLSKEIDIINSSSDISRLELRLPKDVIKLNKGKLNVSNRLITNLEISENENEYIISMNLSDRVSYNIEKISPTLTKIRFTKQDRAVPLIVLDPGHGGKDSGAINKEFNIDEKTLNIQVSYKLKQKLENLGYTVVMTRYDDTFVPLNDIASFSNSQDPDIFISIHHNSVDGNTSAKGIETYYTASEDSKVLASIIQKELISYSGATNRGVKTMPFVVIRKNNSPAVLLELGFMTNKEEIQKNMSDSYQDTLAEAIKSAVNIYFGR